MRRFFAGWLVVLLVGGLVYSCGQSEPFEEIEDYGKFDLVNDFDKADGPGVRAVPVSADDSDTAVWEVENDWGDKDTAEARKAGLAWSANSGLNWNEKYAAWIDGLAKVDGYSTSYKTFQIVNPQGKTITAPVSAGTRIFFGHFGWRTSSGRYKKSNLFRSWYKDYSDGNYSASNWPQDSRLRAKKLYGSDDDYQPFIADDARAGAYFDELFLNKRVGHFLILFLSNFGSIHLADSGNTFNVKAEVVRPGDVLLERWQRRGIGHTLVVKTVQPGQIQGTLMAELVSGSMPRRQPKWEDPTASKRYFTMDATGGEGTNYSGDEYAKLGGGLKRWRVARAQEGWYTNTMLPEDVANWISSTNYEAIAARPGIFEDLLEKLDPEAMRDELVNIINDKRLHLRDHPASCSARIGREDAFKDLYELLDEHYSMDKQEVDEEYRDLEDYIFAELVYTESKTCCWNSTTRGMYEIIMDYNQKYLAEGENCRPPVVFMNDGGYGTFADHAAVLGRADEWVDWSEDESCPQRNVASDTELEHAWTDYCTIFGSGSGDCTDDFEPNNIRSAAAELSDGNYQDLSICSGDDDWYVVHPNSGTLTVSIYFTHANGDLDLKATDVDGNQLSISQGTGDSESIEVSVNGEDVYILAFGYSGATGDYDLNITIP
ncbi:MAG: hypothetical protein JRJ19_09225 [Deltaproteobacteria bacterium]|nr:hypothetical protein [Deltaproteobacteria bacterium]